MAPALHAWLGAFAFTQAVEVPIWAYALAEHRQLRRREGVNDGVAVHDPHPKPRAPAEPPWPFWICAVVGFGASALTHPIVWFVIPRYAPGGYWPMVVQAEVFAVVVEAIYTRSFGLRRALAWSVAANAASAGLGLLSRAMIGWP